MLYEQVYGTISL